ncbi:DNA repair and recombination protein RAD54B [Cercospora beticola]|uniref:DNA repair and recombination protein RAD54B n=2 Tax=Cercospora beticola TaxID=122368 RepID=A0A2G5I494_CERBT|nr:DNA repair and recombination protein RAD54B [Cercospora beticola]PIA99624.1 DNA repair and recombination protein RAD54B [Cercospora beticola]
MNVGIMKPFKPPTIYNRPQTTTNASQHFSQSPPAKRRRISEDEEERAQTTIAAAKVLKKPEPSQKFQSPSFRSPLVPVPNGSSQPNSSSEPVQEQFFVVVWRKFTMKKNKTWDGDGVLSVKGTQARLQNIDGKDFGRGTCKGPLMVGSELSIGGKDVEVESMISRDDYISGRVFLGNAKGTKSAPTPSLKEIDGTSRVSAKEQAKFKKLALTQKKTSLKPPPNSTASRAAFKAPLIQNHVLAPVKNAKVPTPRHAIDSDSLVMQRPSKVPKGKQIVDVVVDPILTRHLRPHQRQGVQFMYECVMGMKDYDGEGAILADEMGLGKTLQTIALLWTLLKQNPIFEEPPVIKKALIVCPVTLVNNWRKEFRKWLGNDRVGVYMVENNKMRLTDFTRGRAYQVMIIGYEKLTKVQKELQGASGIDIVICDEGHRLKSSTNKAASAIKTLSTERRVILSGTPVQNDLAEFHTMVDFVNPNILSKYTTFKREFENPIVKSRQPGAAKNDLEKGEARSAELAGITGKFILRRTAEILSKYLPPKTEYVIFCKPTETQRKIYRHIIGTQAVASALRAGAGGLEGITALKKLCNSPTLLQQRTKSGEIKRNDLVEGVPPQLLTTPGTSAKLLVLDELLVKIRNESDDKVVLVSHYTETMDMLATLVTSLGMGYVRLDGSVAQSKRQDLIDRFNNTPPSKVYIFLLSAKSGGTGLNLVGASRLIMYDSDWNPAHDLQAMARIHRDGQKKPCYIYRFVTQGVMDEKIFQRQITKTGLADSIVDGKDAASNFTQNDLRDLFSFDEEDDCQTHRLLGCQCEQNGLPFSEAVEDEVAEQVGRNDLAKLSGGEIEVLHLEDSDQEEVYVPKKCTTTLGNVDRDAQEAEILRNARESRDSEGKAKMLSLMQYTHLDTSLTRGEEPARRKGWDEDDEDTSNEGDTSTMSILDAAIDDAALRNVIRDVGQRIGYVMTKMGTSRNEEGAAEETKG